MLDKFFAKPPNFEIVPMEYVHCRAASVIHGQRFSRAWSDGEFHSLLGQDSVAGFVVRQLDLEAHDAIAGFVLARAAADEAEILSIGVANRSSRMGLGWRLMRATLQEMKARDVNSVFLEVDETNEGAISLYRKLRFVTVGERPAYYTQADGRKNKAFVMRLDISGSRNK